MLILLCTLEIRHSSKLKQAVNGVSCPCRGSSGWILSALLTALLFVFVFQINLRLILVSGKTKEFLFSPNDSAADIAKHVYDNWPMGAWWFTSPNTHFVMNASPSRLKLLACVPLYNLFLFSDNLCRRQIWVWPSGNPTQTWSQWHYWEGK